MSKTVWKNIKRQYRDISPKFIIYYMEGFIEHFRRVNRAYVKNTVLQDFPIDIEIETISACNARCIMCPNSVVGGKAGPQQQVLSTEMYKAVINEISGYTVRCLALFSQNEPLMDKRIVDLITYGKEKCPLAKVIINTNAFLLNQELSDRILKSGLDHITFSVHGWTEETMKKVSGLDFKTVLSNVTYFIEKRISTKNKIEVGLNCLKTIHFTKKDYDVAFNFSRKYGLPFALLTPTNRADNVDSGFYPHFQRRSKKRIRKCLMDDRPLNSTTILGNGDVVACCMDWKREEAFGNIYQDPLYKIWHSDKYNEFRNKIYRKAASQDNFLCKRCSESV